MSADRNILCIGSSIWRYFRVHAGRASLFLFELRPAPISTIVVPRQEISKAIAPWNGITIQPQKLDADQSSRDWSSGQLLTSLTGLQPNSVASMVPE